MLINEIKTPIKLDLRVEADFSPRDWGMCFPQDADAAEFQDHVARNLNAVLSRSIFHNECTLGQTAQALDLATLKRAVCTRCWENDLHRHNAFANVLRTIQIAISNRF